MAFEFVTSKQVILEAEANVICGKEGEGSVNMSNMIVKWVAKI
jgi:hypothetical protein